MRGHVWSDAELALLRELWSAGETADAIAARLGGLSRAAVLGKVFRLRLEARKDEGDTRAEIDRFLGGMETGAPARRRRSPQRKERPAAPPAPIKQTKSLLELDNKSCRWPHGRPDAGSSGKFFFCGVPEADLERGIPYCPRHMQRAYQPASPPKERSPKVWSAIAFRGR